MSISENSLREEETYGTVIFFLFLVKTGVFGEGGTFFINPAIHPTCTSLPHTVPY